MTGDPDRRYQALDGMLDTALAVARTVPHAHAEEPLPNILKAREAVRDRCIISVTFYCMQAYGCAAADKHLQAVAEALWPALLRALEIKHAELGGARAVPLTERDLSASLDARK